MKKLLIATSILLSLSANAGTKWNMATPYSESIFHTKNVHEFAQDVAKITEGKIDITVHSGASLYKAPEIFKAVRSGQVELGEVLIASLGNDNPLFKIDTLPFVATDYTSAKKLWMASKAAITQALDKKGAVLLYVVPWPGQNFYTKTPITNVDYFKGKKLRSYNATTAEVAANLGASPTTIESSNIPQAFSTGQIDAMITSSSTGVASQSWDFVNYYTRVNAWLPKNMVFINKKTWRRLDSKMKEDIRAAAADAETRGWAMSKKINADNEKKLSANGITISDADSQLKKAFQSVGKKMSGEWLETTGTQGKAILETYYK